MGLGTIALLGMLAAPGQGPSDVTTWTVPSMKIPIDYHPSKRADIRELLLYVSPDQGQTWQQHAVATPEKDKEFAFNAPTDGVYWFNMVVVDKAGRREPADLYKAAPALKVLFDTKKPVVTVTSAQRVGDDVTVVWKIVERNPDWTKFRLEYSANGRDWTPVPTRPDADGSAQFRAPGAGPLTVRVALVDAAGQAGEGTKEVAGTAVVAKPAVGPDAILPVAGTGDLPHPSTLLLPPAERVAIRPPGDAFRGTDTPPAPGGPALPAGPLVAPLESVASAPKTEPVGVSGPAPANLPAAQVINVTSFKLAYEVEERGASGVGKAEVWVTRDDGRTWRPWSTIEKPESTLTVDLAKNNNTQVEGVYGIKVLLHSGAGLSREAPKGGEAPDLRVDVDVTPPIVKIYEPIPDPTQRDTMILRWQAVDRNLANEPITLEWADNAKGPWVPVATADTIGVSAGAPKRLANTGSYAWKLPANFPTPKVYLKVTARDVAGNVAEATTAQPILVDTNKPAAVKLNIVGGASR